MAGKFSGTIGPVSHEAHCCSIAGVEWEQVIYNGWQCCGRPQMAQVPLKNTYRTLPNRRSQEKPSGRAEEKGRARSAQYFPRKRKTRKTEWGKQGEEGGRGCTGRERGDVGRPEKAGEISQDSSRRQEKP